MTYTRATLSLKILSSLPMRGTSQCPCCIVDGSGTICVFRSMLHDEDTYQNPDHFDPERYLNAMGHISFEVPDPDEIASFGFGRRYVQKLSL